MNLPKISPTDVVIIAGKRGSGKTTLARRILSEQFSSTRLLAWDPIRQYDDVGVSVRYTSDLFKALGLDQKMRFRPENRVVFQPKLASFEASEVFFAYALAAKNYFLVIEEADQIATTNRIGARHASFLNVGRHSNLGGIEITRKLNRLNTLPSSQATHIFLFRTFMPADLKYLSELIPPDALEMVSKLERYACLYFNPDTEEKLVIGPEKNIEPVSTPSTT